MGKPRKQPPWIRVMIWRNGEWVLMANGEAIQSLKKGDLFRVRGRREIFVVEEDFEKGKKRKGIVFHSFAELNKPCEQCGK